MCVCVDHSGWATNGCIAPTSTIYRPKLQAQHEPYKQDFDQHVCVHSYMHTLAHTAVQVTRCGLEDTQVGRTGSRTYVEARVDARLNNHQRTIMST